MNGTGFAKVKIRGLVAAISCSSFLFLFKIGGAIFCSSAGLLASAVDSLMDIGMSSVNYLAVRKGSKPPDKDHAYGHEKIESLASYTQGMVILIFAFAILEESVRRSFAPTFVSHSQIALAVTGIAALANLFLSGILYQAERKTKSLILKAELVHYSMDIFSYVFIFFALLLVRWTKWNGWDLLGGMILAGYVGSLAGQILVRAGNELVDRSLPPSALDELDRLIQSHDSRVLGYHEMRTRKVGTKTFVDFHLVMQPEQSFQEAHEVAESLIQKIKTRFEDADVTVHEDPEGGL